VFARGGLDPPGAAAEINMVQVELEDLAFGVALLDREGDAHLRELAAERPIPVRQPVGERVPGELHGDGAEPLAHAERAYVGDERTHGAAPVDPAVLPEALVLDGDEGGGDVGREGI